jgi:hypothetical protein
MIAKINRITNGNLEHSSIHRDEWGVPSARVNPDGVGGVSVSGNRISISPSRKANKTSYGLHRKRDRINGFSRSASYRMAKYLRSAIPDYKTFATLTFKNCPTGLEAKRSFQRFLRRMAKVFGARDGYSLFWFLEFQRRGSIHFHFFCTEFIPKEWLSETWDSCCTKSRGLNQNLTNVQSIRSGRYGTISYAQKYAKKQSQKAVPENFGWVGRFWGVVGNKAMAAATIYLDFDDVNCPKKAEKVRKLAEFVEDCEKKNAVRRRDIQVIDKATKELKHTGVTIWEWNKGFYLRKLYQLINELIEDEEKRLKYPRGWINGEQARQNSKVRPP